jgi:hypothetical protein
MVHWTSGVVNADLEVEIGGKIFWDLNEDDTPGMSEGVEGSLWISWVQTLALIPMSPQMKTVYGHSSSQLKTTTRCQ